MNYITGSLQMFKSAVGELKKEDEVQKISIGIINLIKQAIDNRKAAVVVDVVDFNKVSWMFIEEGYNIAIANDEQVELSGWM